MPVPVRVFAFDFSIYIHINFPPSLCVSTLHPAIHLCIAQSAKWFRKYLPLLPYPTPYTIFSHFCSAFCRFSFEWLVCVWVCSQSVMDFFLFSTRSLFAIHSSNARCTVHRHTSNTAISLLFFDAIFIPIDEREEQESAAATAARDMSLQVQTVIFRNGEHKEIERKKEKKQYSNDDGRLIDWPSGPRSTVNYANVVWEKYIERSSMDSKSTHNWWIWI